MADTLERCSVCQAMLDEEDLFCPNCGTEAPDRAVLAEGAGGSATGTAVSTHNFECQGCGASMSYDVKTPRRSRLSMSCSSRRTGMLPCDRYEPG
jgi:predicted RNA-binding Zn-ribbon protein involved in translation (DUF1610 family)